MRLPYLSAYLPLLQVPDSLTATNTANSIAYQDWILLALFAAFIGWLIRDSIKKRQRVDVDQPVPRNVIVPVQAIAPTRQLPKLKSEPVRVTSVTGDSKLTSAISGTGPSVTEAELIAPKVSIDSMVLEPVVPPKEVDVLRKPMGASDDESFPPPGPKKLTPEKAVDLQQVNNKVSIQRETGTVSVSDLITVQHIGYKPVMSFEHPLAYPFVAVPKPGCVVKFPKKGRFSNRGYKEATFKVFLRNHFGQQFDVLTDHHLLVSGGSNPYEPDFSLIDRSSGLNMCVDVEIDEPYSGLSRRPMHCQGDDTLRNAFFTDRGWIIVRFAEIQVHQDPQGCCRYLANVIESMHPSFRLNNASPSTQPIGFMNMWSILQAQKWSTAKYREHYLVINEFRDNEDLREKLVPKESEADRQAEAQVTPSIKIVASTGETKYWNIANRHLRDDRLKFDANGHQYWIDRNPNTMAVSSLVKRMFPEFDEDYWATRKVTQLGMSKQAVLDMWHANGEESRQLGTKLHTDIETYFDSGATVDTKEFRQFQDFMSVHNGLKPYRTEWRVFDDHYMVAGTVDMVVENGNGGYDLYDWKRSKEIKTDGWGKFGFGPLSHLDDCNFIHYSLQLNFYRWILKAHYDLEVDSMYLVALHPNFGSYKKTEIHNMEQDIEALLESTLVKC